MATLEELDAILAKKEGKAGPSLEDLDRLIEKKETPVNKIEGTAEAVLSGAAWGFSDEIQALVAALSSIGQIPDSDITGETSEFMDRYKTVRDEMRSQASQFRDEEKALAYGGEILGGLTTGLPQVLKRGLLGGAGVGALEGGVAGVGFSDAPLASSETGMSAGIGALAGGTSAVVLPILGRIAKEGGGALVENIKSLFPNATGLQKKFIQQLATPEGLDDDMARYMLNGAQRLEVDPLFNPAVKQGFQPGTLLSIKGATATDKGKFLQMVDYVRKGMKNKNFARRHRPGDIAGNTFLERINYVRDVNQKAGKEIGRIAQGLRNERVNMSAPLQEFAGTLDELGIKVTQNKGKLAVDFADSVLSPGDRGAVKEVVRQVVRVMKKPNQSAFDYHQLKRAIDNNVTWGKSDSLTSDAANLLKGLRTGIDNTLDEAFPDYNKANQVYKETIEAIDAVVSHVGKKVDLDSDNVNKQLGTELRALMGNRKTRANLMDAIDQIETTARNQGGIFDDSIEAQAFFVDDLEDRFGSSAQTSFRAEITKGITDAPRKGGRAAIDALQDLGVSAAEKGLEVAEGVNDEAALNILEQIIKR